MWLHRRGHSLSISVDYLADRTDPSTSVDSPFVSPKVDTEDLIDAPGVAEILGLSHRNSVSLYQRRYQDMPRPVVDLGNGRVKLWLRTEVESWVDAQSASGRTRPARRASR